MSKQVVSTLPAATRYAESPNGMRSVVVKGGWPMVFTEVSDEDAEFLAAHPHFMEHAKRGFVKIVAAAD